MEGKAHSVIMLCLADGIIMDRGILGENPRNRLVEVLNLVMSVTT